MKKQISGDFPCFLNCFPMLFDRISSHGTCVTGPVVKTWRAIADFLDNELHFTLEGNLKGKITGFKTSEF